MNGKDPNRRGPTGPPPSNFSDWLKGSWPILMSLALILIVIYFIMNASGKDYLALGPEEFAMLSNKGTLDVYLLELDRSTDLVYFRGFDRKRELEVQTQMKTDNPFYSGLIEANPNIRTEKKSEGGGFLMLLFNFLPLILFGAFAFFMIRGMRSNVDSASNFGRSRAHKKLEKQSTVRFDDVAGAEEAKEELKEVVEFLMAPVRFQALGAKIPKGVLLTGPPGCGKTLLARAVAGEARVPFFSMSGSEFVEMFVGVGASRVRDLFSQAKRNAPCIIFIDEIDAVGRHRGAGLGGGHDEREQTLNQILVEMDGFESNYGPSPKIIVIAATNRPDILDPAILRPGRFDRHVVLDKPDVRGRHAILEIHSKGKPLAKGVNLEVVAQQTIGFSGADLANLVNEAAILAARKNKQAIDQGDFIESIDKVMAGPERKSRVVIEREKRMTAYHEAGHAVVAHLIPAADPPYKVTIVPRGRTGGHTRYLPAEDRSLWTKKQFEAIMAAALGGRIAEELIFDEITTGASDDLKQATAIASAMVTQYGMSEKLGLRTFGKREEMVFLGKEISEQRDYGEEVARMIDKEVNALLNAARETAVKTLQEGREALERLAQYLIENETIEGDELNAVLQGN